MSSHRMVPMSCFAKSACHPSPRRPLEHMHVQNRSHTFNLVSVHPSRCIKLAQYKVRSPPDGGIFSGFFIQPQSESLVARSQPNRLVIRQKRDLALLQSKSTSRPRTASFVARIRIRSPIHPHCISHQTLFLDQNFSDNQLS